MGYQESLIHCKDFNWLLEKVNKLGKEHFDKRDITVAEIITLDNSLTFTLEEMCHPEIKIKLAKGTRLLWIYGDRGYQHELCGKYGLLGEKTETDKKVEIYYIECVSDQLFSEYNDRKFSYEDFEYNEV